MITIVCNGDVFSVSDGQKIGNPVCNICIYIQRKRESVLLVVLALDTHLYAGRVGDVLSCN